MRDRRLALYLTALSVFLLAACPSIPVREDPLKPPPGLEAPEGFTTFPKGDTPVGKVVPEPGSHPHCCWKAVVGTIPAGHVHDTRGTYIGLNVIAILAAAIGVKVEASGTDSLTVDWDQFDDYIKSTKHECDHAPQHEERCFKKWVTKARMAENVKITSNFTAGGSVKAKAPGASGGAEVSLTHDFTQTYPRIMVAYQMGPTVCGAKNSWNALGEGPDTAEGYQKALREEEEQKAKGAKQQGESGAPTGETEPHQPSKDPKVLKAESAQPVGMLGPPPEHVVAGGVIRVTTIDNTYTPHPPIGGVIVTETDTSGKETKRTVRTDNHGGTWLKIGETTAVVAVGIVGGKEVYRASVRNPVATKGQLPVINELKPYHGTSPPNVLESGSLTEIHATNCPSVGQVLVNGKSTTPLAAGDNYALARLDGSGPAQVQVAPQQGALSNPVQCNLVSLKPEVIPPTVMTKGQQSELAINITGTSEPVPVTCNIESQTISFAGGSKVTRVMSSGGGHNVARAVVVADQPGPYKLTYALSK